MRAVRRWHRLLRELGCPIPGWVGWGFGEHDLVGSSPACVRKLELDGLKVFSSTK